MATEETCLARLMRLRVQRSTASPRNSLVALLGSGCSWSIERIAVTLLTQRGSVFWVDDWLREARSPDRSCSENQRLPHPSIGHFQCPAAPGDAACQPR